MFNLLDLIFNILTTFIPLIYTIKSLDKSIEFNKYSYQFLLNYWIYYISLDYFSYLVFNNLGIINFLIQLAKIWLFYGNTSYKDIEFSNITIINHILFGKFYKNFEKFENYFNSVLNKISLNFNINNKFGDLNYQLNQFGINYSIPIDSNYSINYELVVSQILNFIKPILKLLSSLLNSNTTPNSNSNSKKLNKKIRKQTSSTSFASLTSRSNSSTKSSSSISSEFSPQQQHQQQHQHHNNQNQQFLSPQSIFSTGSPPIQFPNDEINLMKIPKYRISSTPPPQPSSKIDDLNLSYSTGNHIPNNNNNKKRSKSNGDYDLTSQIMKFRQHQAQNQAQNLMLSNHQTNLEQAFMMQPQSQQQQHHHHQHQQPQQYENSHYTISPTQQNFPHNQLNQQYYQDQPHQRIKSNTSSRNPSGSNYNYDQQLNRSENYRHYSNSNNNHNASQNNGYKVNNKDYRDSTNGYKVNSKSMKNVQNQINRSSNNNNNELPAVPTPSMVLQ
ncbi:uncharacterized protein KGF55_001804 [Candida pseudojiufengensis]|uniref:uncharacterized protein n=1 Tax=Candida pseudojiufengensis TaxID=497109 RepID=UPI00222591A6|nr:uncharacterized protein KGF55_001804 [Candida pseudojiufengensis]KAI5964734.1 hypothetical protein KGF55_001804 [Candida pseudojiufengensis]